MPAFNAAFHNAGSAIGTAASGTIAAGSNISAAVAVFPEDVTLTGLTCSQGGATVGTPVTGTASRAFSVYPVVGLSAGSCTFTPTGSGSGSLAIVAIICSDAVQVVGSLLNTLASTEDTDGSPAALSVSTPNTDDLMLSWLFTAGGSGAPVTAGSGTLRASSAATGYGHYLYGATFTRAGTTTTADWTWSGVNPGVLGVAMNHDAGGGGGGGGANTRQTVTPANDAMLPHGIVSMRKAVSGLFVPSRKIHRPRLIVPVGIQLQGA